MSSSYLYVVIHVFGRLDCRICFSLANPCELGKFLLHETSLKESIIRADEQCLNFWSSFEIISSRKITSQKMDVLRLNAPVGISLAASDRFSRRRTRWWQCFVGKHENIKKKKMDSMSSQLSIVASGWKWKAVCWTLKPYRHSWYSREREKCASAPTTSSWKPHFHFHSPLRNLCAFTMKPIDGKRAKQSVLPSAPRNNKSRAGGRRGRLITSEFRFSCGARRCLNWLKKPCLDCKVFLFPLPPPSLSLPRTLTAADECFLLFVE